MKIISVAGATSKAGKTLLAEQIIRYCAERYSPVYGVKFTTTSDLPSPCPRGAPCNVCDLSDRFRIVRDESILNEKGKNTQRLKQANATEVIWVISKQACLPVAYEHLLTHLPENAVVVMEGSTVTSLCKPDLLLYVIGNHIPRARWKDSATDIMELADFIVLNRIKNRKDHPELAIPDRALAIDLAAVPVTTYAAVQDKIESVLNRKS